MNIFILGIYKMKEILRPSTAMTSMVYVLFSSLSKACTVFSSPEYLPIEKYFFVSPCREYLLKKTCSCNISNVKKIYGVLLIAVVSSEACLIG